MKKKWILMAGLLAGTAHADVVCDQCIYRDPSVYLGSYWPGDKGTFINRDVLAKYGQAQSFDNYLVFDLNNTAKASVTITNVPGTAFSSPWWLEVYPDAGSVCDALRCTTVAFTVGTELFSSATNGKRLTTRLELPPGRYVIRLAAGTRAAGDTQYKGSVVIR